MSPRQQDEKGCKRDDEPRGLQKGDYALPCQRPSQVKIDDGMVRARAPEISYLYTAVLSRQWKGQAI